MFSNKNLQYSISREPLSSEPKTPKSEIGFTHTTLSRPFRLKKDCINQESMSCFHYETTFPSPHAFRPVQHILWTYLYPCTVTSSHIPVAKVMSSRTPTS